MGSTYKMAVPELVATKQAQADKTLNSIRHQEIIAHTDNVADKVLSATASLVKYLEGHTSKVELTNQLQSISTPDVKFVVQALEVLDKTLQTHENTDLTQVTALLENAVIELAKLPKEHALMPESFKPIDNTAQLKALATAISAVEKAVSAQKLEVKAPDVHVPKTNVHVEAPDLKPVTKGLGEVKKAVANLVFPEYKTDNKEVEKLLKKQNKILDEILDKPVGGGGGGGGRATPYEDSGGVPFFVRVVQSTVTSAVKGIPVVNPDGSNIGAGSSSPTTPTIVVNGKKTVTVSGTRVILVGTPTAVQGVVIRALDANTGIIYIGNSTVTAANGHTLDPGETVGLSISDLANVYIDAAVSGEGVTFLGS